ncbi:MAG: ACT domain-containing protein [Clostridiales bacterium]|nr:ACT domain-containing protein [Clostridiales bacterium]
MENTKITVTEDVTLIFLHDYPADIKLVADIFKKIADAGIDVDMISQASPNGQHSSLSFTVFDDDFGKILGIVAKLRDHNPELKIGVSSGNCKISVYNENMKGTPGVAAAVFDAVSCANTDIRMITTSEVDISILVVKADVEAAVASLHKHMS